MNSNDEVQKAREVEAALVEKRIAICTRLTKIDDKRQALAFEAHTEGGKARKTLDDFNRERLLIGAELETIEVAIAEAQRRIIVAEQEATCEAERQQAAEVRRIIRSAGRRGERLAEAAVALCGELRGLFDDLENMRKLGATVVNPRLPELAFTRSILALLRQSGLVLDTVPPGQRHDLRELVDGYMASGEAWAAKVLAPRLVKDTEAA